MPPAFRDLTSLEEFAAVVDLERRIWGVGYGDVVPVPILAVTVKRGGILVGAFERDRLIGFVYSIPGLKDGKPMQWSHMLGVVEEYRSSGLGHELKLLQRERALAMGLDLIEWTFDPLQAANAHLNFAKLGVVVNEYEENVYGESTSPLHRGNPTDRFVAQWWIRKPDRRSSETARRVPVNRLTPRGEWFACAGVDLTRRAERLAVEIPTGFTEMLARAPELALAWRLATREIFETYFGRGYRAADFFLDKPRRKGAYLLVRSLRAIPEASASRVRQ